MLSRQRCHVSVVTSALWRRVRWAAYAPINWGEVIVNLHAPSGIRSHCSRSPTNVRLPSARPRHTRAEPLTGAFCGSNDLRSGSSENDQNTIDQLTRKVARFERSIARDRADAIMALLASVEAKDPNTKRHSLHVSIYAEYIARALGMPRQEIRILKNAAVLHDVGKIGTPDEVLTKPGPLTIAEYQLVKEHPVIGASILKPVAFLREEIALVLYHHEWFDGAGYPHGLRGDAIPFGARILQAADSIDAMASTRSYKRAYNVDRILSELRRGRGTQFDPAVADIAMRWLRERPEQVFGPSLIRSKSRAAQHVLRGLAEAVE